MLHRRSFLKAFGAGALAWPGAAAWRGTLTWPEGLTHLRDEMGPAPAADDEDYWDLVRAHFLIPRDRIYLNNGTLGPPPNVVVRAVEEHARSVAETFPPGVLWEPLKEALGEFLSGDPAGFVTPRNTTEAMSFVANGLDIDEGDEVLTTNHEHIGGLSPWELVTTRRRATLRTVQLPVPAESEDQLFDAIAGALSEETRVLSLSHVTFTTGTILPVARLARVCAERGIVFVVDGAHPPGMMRVSLEGIGADFYASSPHKWLLAPQGTGLLHISDSWRTRLWPTIASGDWDDLALGAHRFNHMGTIDESRLAGLFAALEFQDTIGIDRIEERLRYLSARLREGLARIPGVTLASPADPAIAAPMVSFSIEGVESLDLQSSLAESHRIRTRVIGEYGYGWMRLSTHIYNSPTEIDLVLELIESAARGDRGMEPRSRLAPERGGG